MATKLQQVSDLADRTARSVTQNVDTWKQYLTTASRLFKYDFDDQLLIYAQRPDATACASMELWNGTMRRWVKAGSKGIALIHKNGSGRPHLEYVFDVSDTRAVRGAKSPYLWELREEHHAAVAAALEKQYGAADETDIGTLLMEQASHAVDEIYHDHLTDLAYDVGGSLLEDLDDLNLEVRYRNVLTASVQYTLLTRCGLDPSDYMEDEDLWGITEFSTPAVLHHLGDAISNISENLLNEIGRAVRTYDREAAKNSQEKSEKPLAKSPVIDYTTDRERFSALKRESKERSDQHGRADIHEGGRLSDPRPDAGRNGGRGDISPGQVREDAGDIPQEAPPRDIHVDAADRAVGTPSEGDRPAGAGAGGPDGGRPEETERRGREDEGPRPDGMGTGGERLHRPGGGDRPDRDRVQVNPEEQQTAGDEPAVSASADAPPLQFQLFPTVEEQVENIAQAQVEEQQEQQKISVPAGNVPDAVIGRALTSGGNEQHSIERIVAFFQKDPTGSAAASFMEKEFGEGGKGVTIAGQDYALWFSKEGFRIAPGWSAFGPGSTLISWVNAAAMVSNLLRDRMFAAQDKIDAAPDNEVRELAEKLWYLRQDFSDSARERNLLPTISQHFFGKGFPDDTKEIAELLKAPVHRQQIMRELAVFADEHKKSPDLLRFRHHPAPQELLEQVAGLFTPREQFQSVEGFAPAKASFVTEDEITRLLAGGPNISESKLQIYSYFVQGHDAKECAQFLKESYGEGGYGRQGYNENHGTKGISLTREDEESGYKGYDTVTLNWNQVQKRIRSLIDKGQYLNSEERAALPRYEKIQLAKKIYVFQYYNPNDPNRTYPHEWDTKAAERDILPLLGNPEKSAALYADMVKAMALVSPEKDERAYRIMEPALRDMGAFQRGEYSLFTPLPETVLQAERQAKQAEKESKKFSVSKGRSNATTQSSGAPGDRLAAAARALAQKGRNTVQEDQSGQFNLFSMAAPLPPEPESALSQPQQEQSAQPEAAEWAVSPVTLYRDLLEMTDREINRGGWLYEQLRDRSNDYDTAKEALETELDAYVDHVASGYPDIMAAYHTLPKFREWLIEDLMERNYQDVSLDQRDAPDRHSSDADAPEWAQGAPPTPKPQYETWSAKGPIRRQAPTPDVPPVDQPEPKRSEASTEISPAPETVPEPTGAGVPEQQETVDTAPAKPDFTPNVDEYLNLKAAHPGKLVGVQVGDYMLFYGKDAEEAAAALGTDLISQEMEGLGSTVVTGSNAAWQATLKKLLEHGKSVVLARPDPERGPDAPYEIIKERDAADYIPLGMELTIDGRRMKIDSVDFQTGTVSLQDLDMQGWFPIFRSESVPFVREYVEEAQRSEEYIAADMANQLQKEELTENAATRTAADEIPIGTVLTIDGHRIAEETAAAKHLEQLEQVEIDGGQVVPPPPPTPRPSQDRHNFHITDDNLGAGGEKAKYQYNVAAIRTLKQIETEGRIATPEEQEILSRYVGWGGIAQAFDPDDSKWAKEYAELKELLTPDEYKSARSTVVNAHYARFVP